MYMWRYIRKRYFTFKFIDIYEYNKNNKLYLFNINNDLYYDYNNYLSINYKQVYNKFSDGPSIILVGRRATKSHIDIFNDCNIIKPNIPYINFNNDIKMTRQMVFNIYNQINFLAKYVSGLSLIKVKNILVIYQIQ